MAAEALALFRSELLLRILGLLLLQPEKTWTAAELADRLGANSVTVHRELHRALDAGLVTREPIGRTYLYRAAAASPLFEPLQEILERTVGVESELAHALERLSGVQSAFIHGSFARSSRIRPNSDVDLLVLGHVDHHRLRRAIRAVERRIGREVDVLAFEPTEFARLARAGNSFARRVAKGPVKTLVGSRADLPKVA